MGKKEVIGHEVVTMLCGHDYQMKLFKDDKWDKERKEKIKADICKDCKRKKALEIPTSISKHNVLNGLPLGIHIQIERYDDGWYGVLQHQGVKYEVSKGTHPVEVIHRLAAKWLKDQWKERTEKPAQK